MRTIRYGDHGDDVETWQLFLTGQGLDAGAADGTFGVKTQAATFIFQSQNSLTVDGIVGPASWARAAALGLDGPDPAPAIQPAAPDPAAPAFTLPARPESAVTGSQFLDQTKNLSRSDREGSILAQAIAGNVPSFARLFGRVTLSVAGSDGQMHAGIAWVTPEYLAIGSDDDFVRMPMSPITAQRIADLAGACLPTRRLVDRIFEQASTKFRPHPLAASAAMTSNAYFGSHNTIIEQERAGRPPSALAGGHKKDVVNSARLATHPHKVAIYGWHQPNGKVIQPLSTVHEDTYADYSHGIRLVSRTMIVDGAPAELEAVLRDPVLSALLSDEGPLDSARVPA